MIEKMGFQEVSGTWVGNQSRWELRRWDIGTQEKNHLLSNNESK